MNIYEKLQNVRVELAAEGLQKSGDNSYSNYKYFELADFVPQINRLCQKHKLGHHMTISDDAKQVVLIINDMEKADNFIKFSIPLSSANLKASHPVQNLGAVITYSRRYLYIMAFDIVQTDILESITGKENTVAETAKTEEKLFVWDHREPSEKEIKRFWQFVNWNPDEFLQYMNDRAKALNMTVGEEFYEKVLGELISYVQEEGKKGNMTYKNCKFDEEFDIPFE